MIYCPFILTMLSILFLYENHISCIQFLVQLAQNRLFLKCYLFDKHQLAFSDNFVEESAVIYIIDIS